MPARVMIPDTAGGRRRAEGISSREKFYRLADWVVAISGGKLWTQYLRIKSPNVREKQRRDRRR